MKKELEKIFPQTVQSDRGKEFYGAVKSFCEQEKIEMTIRSQPYHPQSQGKVERSHRTFRRKLSYDLVTQKKNRVNWVKNLQIYAKCLNNEKREVLGWGSAFEVYSGRKSNELLKCGFPVSKQKEPKYQLVLKPSEKLIADKVQQVKTTGKVAKN